MSLIIARKTIDSIFIFSDTKLTYIDGIERKNPQDGMAKVSLISDEYVIAFAGNCELAKRTFSKINKESTLEEILKIFNDSNLYSNGEVEFIVCVNSKNKIYLLKDLLVTETNNAWIGSLNGFSKFQENYHTKIVEENSTIITAQQIPKNVTEITQNEFSKILKSFNKVINDESIPEVGGFIIPIAKSDGKFEFMTYGNVYRKPLEIEELINNTTVSFTSPEDGGYVINFCGGNENYICFYFIFGDFGVIYNKTIYGTFEPIILKMEKAKFYNYISEELKVEFGVTYQ